MKLYRIHFIRHGLTKANEIGAYIGNTDYPLSKQGRKQITTMKENLSYPHTDVVYSGPTSRCVQTAGILYPNIKPVLIAGLREYEFGKWEGKTVAELENDEEFKLWLKDSSKHSPPEGETNESFFTRITSSFSALVNGMMEASIENCVIITHAGVINNLLAIHGLPNAKPSDWMVESGCGYSVRFSVQMWMRDQVFEVYQKIPNSSDE